MQARPARASLLGSMLLLPLVARCGDSGSSVPEMGTVPGGNGDMVVPTVDPGATANPDPATPGVGVDTPPGTTPGATALPGTVPPSVGEDVPALPTSDIPATVPPVDNGGMTEVPPVVEISPLDCGPDGFAYENWGPADNRVNYVILGDGYTEETVLTELDAHINSALDRRFNHESGEPYGRYRKFVNICVQRVISANNGIGNGTTAFGGGNGGDRLASVDQNAVNAYLDANIPDTLEIDWRAVVLNQDLWENTGSTLMLWSGGNQDAAGAALHEGGHGFHQLADEYCGSSVGTNCGPESANGSGTEFREVNSTGDPAETSGKWDLWLGHVQMGIKNPTLEATGLQSVFVGSRYVDSGQWRPSGNSMMNGLFCGNAGGGVSGDAACDDRPQALQTSFNSVSVEQMIFSIWRAVRPIDSMDPPEGAVTNPGTLTVNVVDPEVINVDWEIDGQVVAQNGGGQMNLSAAGLTSGVHIIQATAYDNATEDLVRLRTGACPDTVTGQFCHATGWLNSTQTVEWTVTIP